MEFDRLDQSFIDQQVSITRQRASGAAGLESEEVTAVSVAKQSGERIPQKTQVVNRNQDTSKGKVGCKGKNFSDTLAGLLAALPSQWKAITDRVIEAQEGGHRVIAIAGHRVQEGRTTIAQGLFTILSASGWQVRCLDTMQELWCELIDDSQSVAWHRDQARTSVPSSKQSIVLVDAGIWFTRGPFRRREMASRVFGCDAVLLVRHADVPPCPHRQQLLGELGVFPIGEVVTFSGEMECGSRSQDSADSCQVA